MAAGAIPPPLFFEWLRPVSVFRSQWLAFSGASEKHTSVDHAFERPARSSRPPAVGHRRRI